MRVLSIVLSVSLLVLNLPYIVTAQSGGSTTGCITGTVKDTQDAALVGAMVKAKQVGTNLERTTLVEEDGTFQFSQLPPGDYQVSVEVVGFNPGVETITLNIGTTALVRFALLVSGASEVVEVHAATTFNETKTESTTNIDSRNINNLPINERNFLDFALTSARVTRDRAPAQGAVATSGLSFNGQQARFNNITIDGLDNNDLGSGSVRTTFSQDAVKEFQVVSDSYSAEFGRAFGGVVNIVTKGGSNEVHGTTFFFLRNDEISARDIFSSFEPSYKQYQFGTTLSGPLKKDRAFFFTSFERLSIKQNNIITIADATVNSVRRSGYPLSNGPIPFSRNTTSLLARADLQISPTDTLWLRYNGGFNYNGAFEPFGGLVADTNGGIQKLNDNSFAVNNTYVNPQLNLVNETRFLYNRLNQDVLPLDDGPQVRIVAPEGLVLFGRSTILPQPRELRITQFVNNIALSRGRNQIKFGVDYSRSTISASVPILGGGLALFNPIDFAAFAGIPGLPFFSGLETFDPSLRTSEQRAFLMLLSASLPGRVPGFPIGVPLADLPLPSAYIQGFGSSRVKPVTNLFATFFQDEIRLKPNLLLKAGVRYDLNRISFIPKNNGNLSPRLAISYRPNRLPSLNLRAAYGLFFGTLLAGPAISTPPSKSGRFKLLALPLPFSVLPFLSTNPGFPEAEQLPTGVPFTPQLSQVLNIDKNLRSSYTQQLNAGFDYFIDNNTALSVTYDYVRGIKIFAGRNINPVVRPIPGDPLNSALTGRSDPTQGDIIEFESAFDSYYHALTLQLERRFATRFGFRAHYTLSKAIDNFIDFRNDFQEIVDPLRPGDERGLSQQDVRNRVVISGIWELSYTKNRLLKDFQLSGILNLESGRPYNLIAGVDLNMNGDTPVGDRPLGLGRNAGITPGFASFDMRLARTLKITERFQLQAHIEAFNLFNRVNIKEIDRVFPPDLQGNFQLPTKKNGRFIAPPERFRSAFTPRQLQIGLRFTF
ncbi:MAG: carboxypeptidase regulatory-like domain-containing protein [Acidobacteriota bacterium]